MQKVQAEQVLLIAEQSQELLRQHFFFPTSFIQSSGALQRPSESFSHRRGARTAAVSASTFLSWSTLECSVLALTLSILNAESDDLETYSTDTVSAQFEAVFW